MNTRNMKGEPIPLELLEQAQDGWDFAQLLFDEIDRLRDDDSFGSKIAVFSIQAQWIESCLAVIITFVSGATSRGSLRGLHVTHKNWLARSSKTLTLGGKTKFLKQYSLRISEKTEKDELVELVTLLEEYVPLRNSLTHAIFTNTDASQRSQEKKIRNDLDKVIVCGEKINNEIYRIQSLMFPIMKDIV